MTNINNIEHNVQLRSLDGNVFAVCDCGFLETKLRKGPNRIANASIDAKAHLEFSKANIKPKDDWELWI